MLNTSQPNGYGNTITSDLTWAWPPWRRNRGSWPQQKRDFRLASKAKDYRLLDAPEILFPAYCSPNDRLEFPSNFQSLGCVIGLAYR
jgi:hypothetical protein